MLESRWTNTLIKLILYSINIYTQGLGEKILEP